MSGIRDEDVPSLSVGDVIYECEYFTNIEVRILVAPEETGEGYEGRRQWRWKAENTQTGEPIDYMLTEGLSHYGPRLYRLPEYAKFSDGKVSFPRLGGADLDEASLPSIPKPALHSTEGERK